MLGHGNYLIQHVIFRKKFNEIKSKLAFTAETTTFITKDLIHEIPSFTCLDLKFDGLHVIQTYFVKNIFEEARISSIGLGFDLGKKTSCIILKVDETSIHRKSFLPDRIENFYKDLKNKKEAKLYFKKFVSN